MTRKYKKKREERRISKELKLKGVIFN